MSSPSPASNPLVFWNAEQATKSIERILDITKTVYPGHDRPFRVRGDRTEYLVPFDMSIGGIHPGTEGLKFEDAWPQSFKRPWIMPGVEQKLN